MKEYFIWLLKTISFLVIVLVVIPILLAFGLGSVSKGIIEQGTDKVEKAVAVVELTGLIDSSKEIVSEIYKNISDDGVEGIVLRINSPGGAVGPSEEIFRTVKQLKEIKPIVVSMDGVAASGGLYSALAASRIYANPGTMTGSIGVIMSIPNFSKLAGWAGVDMVTIKSGELKDAGNMYREMLPEERYYLEQTAAKVHEVFIQAVIESRNIPRPVVEGFADGRIILGSEAKELKLIDEIGGVYDAARAVYELAGRPLAAGELPKLRYSSDRFETLKKIFKSIARTVDIASPGAKMHYLMH